MDWDGARLRVAAGAALGAAQHRGLRRRSRERHAPRRAGGRTRHALQPGLAAGRGALPQGVPAKRGVGLTADAARRAEAYGVEVAAALGCNDEAEAAACMRAQSVDEIIAAGGFTDRPICTVDGAILPGQMQELMAAGGAHTLDIQYLFPRYHGAAGEPRPRSEQLLDAPEINTAPASGINRKCYFWNTL